MHHTQEATQLHAAAAGAVLNLPIKGRMEYVGRVVLTWHATKNPQQALHPGNEVLLQACPCGSLPSLSEAREDKRACQ